MNYEMKIGANSPDLVPNDVDPMIVTVHDDCV